jgi:hypothetical protein
MIKWFKNIYDKFYERYLCYYLYIDHKYNIIRISSKKRFSFSIKIPYLDFENKIDFRNYLDMYLILHGFVLSEFNKVIFEKLNEKRCFLSLEKLG